MQQIDVAVLGAGFAGAATAWALAGQGRTLGISPRVAVFEREVEVGKFASGRNAGILRAVVADPHWAARCHASLAALRRSDLAPLFAPVGCWLTSGDEDKLEVLAQRARAHDVAATQVEAQAAVAEWGVAPAQAAALAGYALRMDTEGVVDPMKLLAAMLTAAQARATTLHLGCGVTALRPETLGGASGWRVTTNLGDWFARVVVNAAGSWCDGLVQAAGLPVLGLVPMKRHIMRLRLPDAARAPTRVWWHVDAREHYIRPFGPHEFIASTCDAAATHADDYETAPGMLEAHRAHLEAWLPWLGRATITTQGCLRTFLPGPMAADAALVRTLAPGYVAVCGLGGHGATVAPLVGEQAAALVATLLA